MSLEYYAGDFTMTDDEGEVLSEHRAFWVFEQNYPEMPDYWILQTVDGLEEKHVDPEIWKRAEDLDYKLELDNDYY